MHRSLTVLIALICLAAAGCGSSGPSSRETSGPPATRSKAIVAPPAALLGTYTTTLKKSDLPAPTPPELSGQLRWTLKITKDGGVDNAPTVTIIRPPSDVLESPTLSVSGDTLKLSNEECAAASGGYTIVSSSYRFKLENDRQRLTTAKPGCPDKVAQTILASEPWMRR
jgi:hypothetical protein